MENENAVPVLALGVLELFFESYKITLSDCHYSPSFLLNVISISLLANENYEFSIKNNICSIIVNGLNVLNGSLVNGIYLLSQPVTVMSTSSCKRPRIDNVNEAYLWHCRLGHINKNRINKLIEEGLLSVSDCESLSTCESCLIRKMTKSPFKEKDERASDILGLIHTDVCGPMNTSARGGFRYFITFTDDLSSYGYVYLMRHKSDLFKMFKRYRNEVEK